MPPGGCQSGRGDPALADYLDLAVCSLALTPTTEPGDYWARTDSPYLWAGSWWP